jgi:hypothetical protein
MYPLIRHRFAMCDRMRVGTQDSWLKLFLRPVTCDLQGVISARSKLEGAGQNIIP